MDKTYDPRAIEQALYAEWEAANRFAPSGEGRPYCIMLPPPNVTGTLHMGHAFQDTLMDALMRYHRMKGFDALWQGGTDHAGIATQMVVERQLAAKHETRHSLGREEFLKRVWAWKEESGGQITRQLRRLGASIDWSRERFTMDEGLSKAVTEIFVRLHEDGLIYRGKRLVNWDPVLHTAVSDLEVIAEEENGHLWHMRYPLVDGGGDLVVATTRPETMLGDTAVAVHPEDERYKHLIGRHVQLPLCDRTIPVIADDYVDPAFGTGCVKITPAHDFNDYAVGQRHSLPLINIFTIDAKINDEAPETYRGLDRYEARKRIVADLEELGLLDSIKDHKLMVPRGDRSNAVIEPFLTDQWYVDLTRDVQPDGRPGGRRRIAIPAIRAVEEGNIRFVPDNWKNTYYQWMHNLQDWCISRQLWWGHRIPAWYDEAGKVYVGRSEEEVRRTHALGDDVVLTQDEDVLDTWFSSALWPFSTLGWPEQTPELARYYPTSVLVTGFDIIFFWVARMVMAGLYFMDDVPFREVYVTGLIRDAEGQKMSKSKGNVLDPIDLIDGIGLEDLVAKRTTGLMQPQMAAKIEKATRKQFPDGIPAFGTDAIRFTLAALATNGRDIKFDLGRVEGYRNFCNKLWNAARYVLMNTEGQDTGLGNGAVELSLADRWIVSRLQQTTAQTHTHLDAYRFDLAAQALYEFTWYDYCDWYLELCKPVLTGDASDAAKRGTRRTLVTVLETLTRLMHPLMPFITETIWQRAAPLALPSPSGTNPPGADLNGRQAGPTGGGQDARNRGAGGEGGSSIMDRPFPEADRSLVDEAAETDIRWVQDFVLGLRRIRAEQDIPPGKPLPILIQNWSDADRARFDANAACLKFLARPENVTWLDNEEAPESAIAFVGEMKILIPLAGLIDKDAEIARLEKEIAKLDKNIGLSKAKLDNPSFAERAPAEVVEKERARVAEMETARGELEAQMERIRRM